MKRWLKNKAAIARAQDAAQRSCRVKGATIWANLTDIDRAINESLVLTPEEWYCLRTYLLSMSSQQQHVVDVVWRVEDGKEKYFVQPGWDIASIDEL